MSDLYAVPSDLYAVYRDMSRAHPSNPTNGHVMGTYLRNKHQQRLDDDKESEKAEAQHRVARAVQERCLTKQSKTTHD